MAVRLPCVMRGIERDLVTLFFVGAKRQSVYSSYDQHERAHDARSGVVEKGGWRETLVPLSISPAGFDM